MGAARNAVGRQGSLSRLLLVGGLIATGLVGAAVGRAGVVIAAVVPAVVGLLGLLALVRFVEREAGERRRRLTAWTLGSFALHGLLAVAISTSATAVLYLGPDAVAYHLDAQRLVARWHQVPVHVTLPAGKEGFFYLLAGLYQLLGPHRVAGLLVNAALSAALIPLGYDVTRRLFGPRAARAVPLLLVLLPGFVVWTSQLLREAPTLFLLLTVADSGVRLSERFSIRTLTVLSAALGLLFTFRATVALVASAGIVAGLALGRRRIVTAVGTGVAALGLTLALVLAAGVGYTGYTLTSRANLRQVSAVRASLGTAGSGYGSESAVATPAKALGFLPTGLLYFLLGPFPWQVHGIRQLPALADAACLWFLLPSVFRGLVTGWRRCGRRLLVILLPAAAISITLALFLGNFGTVVRERLQVLVLLIPIVALGLDREAEPQTSRLPEVAPIGA